MSFSRIDGLVATAYIGLGSNMGDRLANLRLGLRRLSSLSRLEEVSSLYETEAVGVPQPRFYNAVCRITTGLGPLALLRFMKLIEREAGRKEEGTRGGPRPLDLDILLYNQEIVSTPDLVVPHPRIEERAFVLVPLCELAPDMMHPVIGRTINELLNGINAAGVDKVSERGWEIENP